jgi:hypothetical protein
VSNDDYDAATTTVTRLIVSLNGRSSVDLDELARLTGYNKTTVVNQAIQVYGLVVAARMGTPERAWLLPADGPMPEARMFVVPVSGQRPPPRWRRRLAHWRRRSAA